MTALHYLTITELSELLGSKQVSPVEVTAAMLTRIDSLDGELESYATMLPERALDQARRAEADIAAGEFRGGLHGVPVAIKDLCDIAGVATMAGAAVLRDNVAAGDSTVTSRLDEAGAVTLGKLNLTEGAMAGYNPDFGVPVNPWNTDRWAGVSSSGSGVATAAGLCFGSLGSDTGGSIRFPAAANGVVGLKPTYGRVSRHGVFPLAETLDHVGPLTRSSRDAALMLQAIAGPDDHDPTTVPDAVGELTAGIDDGVAGMRIGLDESWATDGVDGQTVTALQAAIEVLRDGGATLVDIEMPMFHDEWWFVLAAAEAAVAHMAFFPERAGEYGGFMAAFIEQGRQTPGVAVAAATQERHRFNGRLQRLFTDVDVILSPVMPRGAFVAPRAALRGTFEDVAGLSAGPTLRYTGPYDFSGSPTISLPAGFDAEGMPLSVQFAGRHLDEALLCRLGHTFERATDWHTQHPNL